MSKTIGIVGMSAKPLHRGHEAIINAACEECKTVYLIVSLTDRTRPGEVIIEGVKTELIWQYMMEKLPTNATVIFTGKPTRLLDAASETVLRARQELETFKLNAVNELLGRIVSKEELEKVDKLAHGVGIDTPVGWTWWLLSVFHTLYPEHTFNVYVGPDDADRFPPDKITQYIGENAPVEIRVIGGKERLFGVSGTQMREWLARGNMHDFMENLPTVLPRDARQSIWRLLIAHGVQRAPLKKIKNIGKKK